MRGLIAAPRWPLIATAVPRMRSKPRDLPGNRWKPEGFTRMHSLRLRSAGEAGKPGPLITFVSVAAKFVDRPARAQPPTAGVNRPRPLCLLTLLASGRRRPAAAQRLRIK